MDLLNILNEHFPLNFDNYELLRDGGSDSYSVFSGEVKYFLRVIKPAFFNTALIGANVQVYLQGKGFPVPKIIFTTDNRPYVQTAAGVYILYEFIEGEDCNPELDTEAVGALVGRLHYKMKGYEGNLLKRDKRFFIGRYVDILENRKYPNVKAYSEYGDALWNAIKDLPFGYCHGDMYCGNIRKTPDGKLFIHDFDTSCLGFPMYDLALICDMTEYFNFDTQNYGRSKNVLARFLPEYRKYNAVSQAEADAFYALIALQHFSTQATIMEIYGNDCLSDAEIDGQLDWLNRWREQCEPTF